MRLTLAIDNRTLPVEPRVEEGDPLPPADRVCTAPRSTVDRLYRDQAARLLRFFSRRVDRDDAEDLTNDSFLKFISAPAVQDGKVENAEGYLREVAKNALRNRARAAFHRSMVALDLDPEIASDGADPTAMLEARDMLARTELSLAKLPPKTRSIFMAHRLDGATYADLAEAHGLSVKGIEWHMSKAIAHLHRVAGKR